MTPPPAIDRPLSIAEIFDRAVTLCVYRWRTVVVLGVIAALPDTIDALLHRGRSQSTDARDVTALVVTLVVGALCASPLLHAFGDPRAREDLGSAVRLAVRDFRSSLLIGLVTLSLAALAFAVAALLIASAFGIGAAGGRTAGIVTGALVAVPAVLLLVPFLTVMMVAYPTVILERAGVRRGLGRAWRRVTGSDVRRMWPLGAALGSVGFGLPIALSAASDQIAALPGMWWVSTATAPLNDITFSAYEAALATVIAIDLRNRREGADLEAVLDGTAPA